MSYYEDLNIIWSEREIENSVVLHFDGIQQFFSRWKCLLSKEKNLHCLSICWTCFFIVSVLCDMLLSMFVLQPKDHKMLKPSSFQALEKELVFDIDMTDYDDVRSCCS